VNIESIVRECFSEAIGGAISPDGVDLSRRLVEDYGVTSLQLVMLVTSVCEACDIPLTSFTERDIAGMKRTQDIIHAMQRANDGDT